MIPTIISPRPRFADALELIAEELLVKARVELQLDEEAVAEWDARDRDALGWLVILASTMGRPFTALCTVVGHPAPYVALVSYRAELGVPFELACRVCGCVDDDCVSCIERTGEPCSWVKPGLCSACDLDRPGVAAP